jgi:outer membrane usher protein
MLRFHLTFTGSTLFFLSLSLGPLLFPAQARADQSGENLQLEVFINDAPMNMISSFVRFADGGIGAKESDLEQLGLRPGLHRAASEIVLLDEIPTLQYRYDERAQKILIHVSDDHRIARIFDLQQNSLARAPRAQAGWGATLNYDFLGTTGNLQSRESIWNSGSSLTLDGRAFSPYGTFGQSALLLSNQALNAEAIRLDSSYRFSDQDRLITYDLGDAITGGLAWTRPIRIGGAQAQSNFALRPDLITMPLPSLGGTAAVPSTVDVYVNNTRTFSQELGAGPFNVTNIPLVTGAGNAQLVVRDSSGQATTTTLPFYASSILLAPGLTSWSLEAGAPRLAYGSAADSYVGTAVASATLRRGIFDWLTLEGHAEGGANLANGGFGAAVKTGSFGVADAAVAGSTFAGGGSGLQTYLSYDTRLLGLNVNVSLQRTFARYNDLASVTAQLQSRSLGSASYLFGLFDFIPYYAAGGTYASLYQSALPPRETDRITIGAPFPFDDKASWGLSYLHQIDAVSDVSDIVSLSYSRSLPHGTSVFATAYSDVGTNKSLGIVVGLTIPFGTSSAVTAAANSAGHATTGTVDAIRSLGPKTGDYGWEVRDSEGTDPYRAASISYRSGYLTAKLGVGQGQGNSNAAVELRGSITTMGHDVFLSDWIDDGFAVVNAGAPNVEVAYENQPIGKTDSQGMLLVPTLRSYQKNSISVDPANMPVDAEIESTREVVAPADRAGTLVTFKVHNDSTAAVVAFVRADGKFVAPGSHGRLDGGEQFFVGYDGEAFIRTLGPSNTVSIETEDAQCHATFDFKPRPGAQVRIGPVICQ